MADEDDNEEPAHSKLGASSREQWSNCQGRNQLIASLNLPPERRLPSAERGERLHEHSARKLRCYLAGWPFESTLDGDEQAAVDVYVGAAVRVIEQHSSHAGCTAYVEQRAHLKKVHPLAFGTMDFALCCRACSVVHVMDAKFGNHRVKAEENKQLLFYGVGGLLENDWRFKHASLSIVQPAVRALPDTWVIPNYRLFDEIDVIRQEALATEVPGAPLKVGPWCFWCPAVRRCPAKRAANAKEACDEFEAWP